MARTETEATPTMVLEAEEVMRKAGVCTRMHREDLAMAALMREMMSPLSSGMTGIPARSSREERVGSSSLPSNSQTFQPFKPSRGDALLRILTRCVLHFENGVVCPLMMVRSI